MAEEKETAAKAPETESKAPEKNTKDEVALELLKFIATATGYGKSPTGAGFAAKNTIKSPEEQADALLELFDRCRKAVAKPVE